MKHHIAEWTVLEWNVTQRSLATCLVIILDDQACSGLLGTEDGTSAELGDGERHHSILLPDTVALDVECEGGTGGASGKLQVMRPGA